MKSSKYNVFFDHDGKKIGFNSYSREYIALDQFLYLMYDASDKRSDFSEIKEVHPEFHSFLIEKGFLVEPDLDELQRVKDIVMSVDNDESRFELHINPTMNCNFKCWYCYETHIKDSKMDAGTMANVVKLASNILEGKKGTLRHFSISWFGGEPLLYYKKVVVPLLKEVNELCASNGVFFSSSITTNALLIDQNVVSTAKSLNLNFFQITLDGNRDRHNKVRFISEGRGSYDEIVSNIKLLTRNGIHVVARINCSTDTLPGLKEIVEDFVDMSQTDRDFISFDIQKVWQEHTVVSDDVLNEVRWYYRERGFVVSTPSHDTVLHSCYGDHKNHATVNYNGEVFKCTARDFTTANSEGVLNDSGEIIWNPKYEKRLNSKFKNKPCLECAIMPICNGGCSQQAIEHDGVDYCVHDFDENKKRDFVVTRFLESCWMPTQQEA